MDTTKRIEPAAGQESVWDYPRPPLVEPVTKRLRVEFDGVVIADTTNGHRVCETSHAPAYYIPPSDIDLNALVPADGASFCEWKGVATYFDVVGPSGRIAERSAWTYTGPEHAFAVITNHIAFYAGMMDACHVGDAVVRPMDGDFYGGWITPELVGPFKGAPGTRHW